jgi:hypothetical protein
MDVGAFKFVLTPATAKGFDVVGSPLGGEESHSNRPESVEFLLKELPCYCDGAESPAYTEERGLIGSFKSFTRILNATASSTLISGFLARASPYKS